MRCETHNEQKSRKIGLYLLRQERLFVIVTMLPEPQPERRVEQLLRWYSSFDRNHLEGEVELWIDLEVKVLSFRFWRMQPRLTVPRKC